MNAQELYEFLQERKVKLWQDGKMLRFKAPENAISKPTIALLRKHKSELLHILEKKSPSELSRDRLEPAAINQQAMYFLHTSAPYSPAYNVASACRIRSQIDLDAMRKSLSAIITRHDALRTTFELSDGELRRRIHSEGRLDFEVVPAGGLTEQQVDSLVKTHYEQPFDLQAGPLLRARLFEISSDSASANYVFLITLHHIIFDAWSLWLLQDELRTLYGKFSGFVSSPASAALPTLGATYSDYVRDQQLLGESSEGEAMASYWHETLSGDLPTLELPTDRPRPKRSRMQGASQKFRIASDLTQQLRALAKEQRVTPFVLMLAVYKLLLSRYSGENDVIVGTTTSGRSRTAYTRVVGYFVNTLAIRSSLAGNPSFVAYLSQLKEQALAAIKHQDYPYPLIVDKLNPQRGSQRRPIFNVMFGLQKPQKFQEVTKLFDGDETHFDMGGLEVHSYDLEQQEGQFDLTLELFETGESFLACLKYDIDLFDADTAKRIGDHYLNLLQQVVELPKQKLSEFQLVGNEETTKLLGFSAGESLIRGNEPAVSGVHELFEHAVDRTPDKTAFLCGEDVLTYAELNRRANRLAREIRSRGLQTGDLVACCYQRGSHTAEVMLAVLKAGGVFVPLDRSSPSERLARQVAESRARVVISDLPFASTATEKTLCLELAELLAATETAESSNLAISIPSEQTAYVLYTSGSTGTPKGVCVPHAAFVEHVLSIRETFGLREDDVVLQFSNLTFDPSLEQMFAPWSLGAKVVARGEKLWTPETLWSEVALHRLTMINLPPEYFKHCSNVLPEDSEIDSLRLVILGGDVFPIHSLSTWAGRGVQILNAYGPTEAVITATVYDATNHDPTVNAVPIGQPIKMGKAYVVDDQGRLAAIGVAGELCLGGSMLASGYLNDPELTAKKFVDDPFSKQPNGKMYRTGDRARWLADGSLEFLGRADRQIKIHGMRVETGEIESAITSTPGVQQAFVSLREDKHGVAYLVAWVVADEICGMDTETLRSQLRMKLPRHMVPRQFVQIPKMPISSAGKIDVRALPEPAEVSVRSESCEFVAPRTPEETLLATIWSDELNVQSVGVKDNFFDLGGASLTSLRIVSRASEEGLRLNGEPLKPELLFEYPTVGELAAFIDSQSRT